MLDASNISNFNQTDAQLEENILFWVCAAGKNGTTATRLLETFLNSIARPGKTPFGYIRDYDNNLGPLPELMKFCGIGCYNHKARTFKELAHSGLDLKTCTTEDLEKIYGIGMKTSRCFIIHSRKNANCAGLDTHILKFLRTKGLDVPKTTPGSKKIYLTLEKSFLSYAKQAGKSIAEFDLEIWNRYAVKSTTRD